MKTKTLMRHSERYASERGNPVLNLLNSKFVTFFNDWIAMGLMPLRNDDASSFLLRIIIFLFIILSKFLSMHPYLKGGGRNRLALNSLFSSLQRILVNVCPLAIQQFVLN
jgi:hypothetical protein